MSKYFYQIVKLERNGDERVLQTASVDAEDERKAFNQASMIATNTINPEYNGSYARMISEEDYKTANGENVSVTVSDEDRQEVVVEDPKVNPVSQEEVPSDEGTVETAPTGTSTPAAAAHTADGTAHSANTSSGSVNVTTSGGSASSGGKASGGSGTGVAHSANNSSGPVG